MIRLTKEMREKLYTKGFYIGARHYYEYNHGLKLVCKFDKHGLVCVETKHEDIGAHLEYDRAQEAVIKAVVKYEET